MYFINVFVKGGGGVCTRYIRMGRDVPTKVLFIVCLKR